jgi:hypothetical protein
VAIDKTIVFIAGLFVAKLQSPLAKQTEGNAIKM